MFDWFKPKQLPTSHATSSVNPSQGIKISIAFTNSERTWTENVDLLSCLSDVLRTGGYSFTTEKSWIQLDSGLVLQPGIVSFKPLQEGGVQTLTTIEVNHPAGIPSGIFEFQHSTGTTTLDSSTKGFDGWMQLDLPVFIDALRTKPEKCTFMEFDLPASGSTPSRKRRVVLGPVSHLASRPAKAQEEEHAFCPCCLLTHSMEAMKPKIFDSAFYGIRMFAMRNQDGVPGADCRLNGQDWESGKSALIEYVKAWPDRGVEFRKQYAIIQTLGH